MTQLFEGVGIALASLRGNKGRAALTILGIAIGVMVVMVIAAMITGINHGISTQLESLGPRTFFVFREFQPGIHVDDGSRRQKRPPPLTVAEAEHLTTLPSLELVGWGSANGGIRVEFAGRHLSAVVFGRTANWLRFGGGDVLPGRSFTELEFRGNARVAVISDKLVSELFGRRDPIGQRIKVAGLPYDVIGVYNPPPQLFGAGSDPEVYMPYTTYQHYVETWRGWMEFLVSPRVTVTQAQAVDDVIAAMRGIRGLKPGDDNNFAIVTQDKFMDAWNQLTGVFFMVMVALSSVGLLVGGVGVVAMMMISVTERTREIGVRKALGAKRREILWQFLVEAGTLTLVGGASGMVVGGIIALILSKATPIPAAVPVWSIAVALLASAVTGIGFGLYPAAKAARLDPVEALRYE
jgi:putative ABC transport system permease protein